MTLLFLLFISTLFLGPLPLNGEPCPLQGNEDVSLCAMCSDRNAAVRWNTATKNFVFFNLIYNCSLPDGTFYGQSDDDCFEDSPISEASDSRTGVSSVSHELWTGINCEFRVGYHNKQNAFVVKSDCVIKSPEACAANPDECQVDRISEMKEDGECQYHCAAGLAGELCNNVDECEVGNTTCDENADCHDTDGSYWCQCRSGFTGDGYNCTDVNECHNHTCADENAHCVNYVGNFSCQCKPGFTGDGYNCSDVDECVTCSDENAHCVNSVGNFSCQCDLGYTGDGYNCSDINECSEGTYLCPDSTVCINLLGSYNCSSYYDSKESFKSIVAVVCGVLIVGVLLILITVTVIAVQHYIAKKERPSFQEITQMELDPYYEPTFSKGSLVSIHSIFQNLTFSNSMMDINYSEMCDYRTESPEDRVSIGRAEQVSDLTLSHIVESHEGELHKTNPHHVEEYNETKAQEMNTHSPAPNTSEDIEEEDHAGLIDSEVQTHSNGGTLHTASGYATSSETIPSHAIHCTGSNSHLSQVLTDGILNVLHPNACASNEYISEDSISGSMITSITDRANNEPRVNESATCSNGYVTESMTSVGNACSEQELCVSDNLQWNRQHRERPEIYAPSSESSGYASGSTTSRSICGKPYNTSAQEPQLPLGIPSRCDSDLSCTHTRPRTAGEENYYAQNNSNSYMSSFDIQHASWKSKPCEGPLTDAQAADIDCVKFAVNTHQEFEYINSIEDTLSDISFDVVT